MKVFEVKPSYKLIYVSIFMNMLLCMAVSLVVIFFKSIFSSIGLNIITSSVSQLITVILLLVIAFNIIKTVIQVCTIKYTMTETDLLYTKGLLNLKTENLNLKRIIDISQYRPIECRMLGLANVVLHTIDKTNPTLELKGIENFEEITNMIKESIDKNKPNVSEAIHIHQEAK